MNRINFLVCILMAGIISGIKAQNFTNEDLWGTAKFAAKRASGFESMKDGIHFSNTVETPSGTAIIRLKFEDGKTVDTLLSGADTRYKDSALKNYTYEFSPDEKYILLMNAGEMIYRHSMKSDAYLWSRDKKQLKKLTENGKLMSAAFSPDGNYIAFVRDNNLFLVNTQTFQETQVTKDGKRNEIINASLDWVYEEEFSATVNSRYKAMEWSPDSRRIAYYKFNESGVKEFNLTTYGTLYPKESTYKYPKAGEDNSKVSVYVYELASAKNTEMQTGKEWEYIPRFNWTKDPMQVSVQRMNRHQNVLELVFCNVATGVSKLILRDTNNTFIEVNDDLTFLNDGKRFIWTSSRSGYQHIYLYGIDGKLIRQITSGNYDVTHYYGFDEKTSEFFYQSAEPTPRDRQVVSMSLKGKKKFLSDGKGVHSAEFSEGFNYYADTYSNLTSPPVSALFQRDGKQIRVLEDNAALNTLLKSYAMGKTDTFSISTSDNVQLLAWKIVPPDFSPAKKYPVLLYLYGGPGKQTVTNEWFGTQQLWHYMMAQKGYIIISVDNRGTPGRGIDFMNCIYKDMGNQEVKDQVEVADWIKKQSWADANRVGVWGWSFGGYMSALLMTKTPDAFKAGIAVAPVTNWRYYDNVYTERYLQTPQENPKGYDDNSPINYAKNLKGKFMLVHGSGDDNVHFQNTMEFINALVKNNRQFDLMIYPNCAHGISGGGARLHLFTMITDFIEKNL